MQSALVTTTTKPQVHVVPWNVTHCACQLYVLRWSALKHGLANFLKSHFFKLNHSSHASSLVWDSFCKVNNPEKWKPPLLPFSLNYQELPGKSFLLWWKLSFFSCQPFLWGIFRIGPVWQGSPLLNFSRGHVETREFKIHRRAGVP